LEIASEVGKAS